MTSISRPLRIWRLVLVYGVMLFVLTSIQIYPGLWSNIPAPDFLLFIPLVVGIARGGRDGFALGLIAGFLRDYLAGRLYGPGMLEGMIIGLIAAFLFSDIRRIFWRRLLLLWLGVSLAHEFVMSLLSYLFPIDRDLVLSFRTILRKSAADLPLILLANLFATVLILFFLLLGFYQRKKQREKSGAERFEGYNRAL
ncbi:MAG: rod shape-determining protein MreD [Eubacteriales bacterium]|nr:rod shape-determining protein MreD [Eubacteriales bacterium]MDD4324284.1 rod shape-determining protein MreD [Eubacteriales bacterium]MDD4541993.1 rod shape-determining protein MreD [Eubacteriales bacterium]